ncbi:MAG: galactose mutarotase [Clostridia bacterium]|nr:galactose mutarotase [Clostridia bacterium]
MSITSRKYAELGDKQIYAYTLDNEKGLSAEILNYGGAITRLVFNGIDVALGWKDFGGYIENRACYGAMIGRNSNRIVNAQFELNGETFKLSKNDRDNNLHSGPTGFHTRIWDVECVDKEEPSIILTRVSPDGEEGFPGNAAIKVTYTLTKENALEIHYEGECDKDTIINMTNHTYFNPNGHNSGSVEECKLRLASSFYTPNTDKCYPDGRILPVDKTPFDFRKESTIGSNLAISHEQTEMFGGLDHNFVLDGRGYRSVGVFTGDKSGISIEIYTDLPGIQLYIPRKSNKNIEYKDGAKYCGRYALCLETQMFPNAMSYSHFPSVIVKAGEKYDTKTAYKFTQN